MALKTAEGVFLAGDFLHVAKHALDSLERRYPGLKVIASSFESDSASLLLDFSRCDEDLGRVIQSYKNEVRKLAMPLGFSGRHFWHREYEERQPETEAEIDALRSKWRG